MLPRQDLQTAFLTSGATPFVPNIQSISTCLQSTRRRRRQAAKWRCVQPNGGTRKEDKGETENIHLQNTDLGPAESQSELTSESQPEVPADSQPPVTAKLQMGDTTFSQPEVTREGEVQLFEGELAMTDAGGLDAGLEAALSKSWGSLEAFSVKKKHAVVAMSSEQVGNPDGNSGEEQEQETEMKVPSMEGDADDKNEVETKETGPDGISSVEQESPSDVQFLNPSQSLASDDAVSTINDAKKGKRKKRATTSKAKAGSKKKASKPSKDEKEPLMTQAELLDSEEWNPEPRWFFLQVKPGCEQSTAISIRNMTHSLSLEVMEVLVPTTKIMSLTKSGKSISKEERLFPSYILVLMEMNRRNYAEIQRVPNVQWFMGDPNREKTKNQPFRPPLPVSDAEMRIVFERLKVAGSAKPEVKTTIRPGDTIEVISGTFEGNMGTVIDVKPDINVIVAKLRVFAREASTELEMHQVKIVEVPLDDPNAESGNGDFASDIPVEHGIGIIDVPKPGFSKERIPSAGLASAADDLALLLSETQSERGGEENTFSGVFAQDQEMLSFTGQDRKSAGEENKRPSKLKGNRSTDKPAAEGLASFLGDGDDELSLFNDLDISDKKDASRENKGVDESSQGALITTDDELASFLSHDDDADMWEPSKVMSSVTSPMAGGHATHKAKNDDDDEDDDLFAFLDDDDFEEAAIFPDVSEEPASKGSRR